jgi:hypothetical protein
MFLKNQAFQYEERMPLRGSNLPKIWPFDRGPSDYPCDCSSI